MTEILKDPSGKLSSTRVTNVAVTLVFLAVWAVLSLRNGYMTPVSGSIIMIYAILSGQKGLQSFAEQMGKNEIPKTN